MDGGQGVASRKLGTDATEDCVIIEKAIELSQLGLELQSKLRDQGEEVDGIVAVAEHGSGLRNATGRGEFTDVLQSTDRCPTGPFCTAN